MKELKYEFTRESIMHGFDHETCKVGPYIMYDGKDTAVLNYGKILLCGSDCGCGSFSAISHDGGKTFGEAKPLSPIMHTDENGVTSRTGPSATYYNKFHKKWLVFCFRGYRKDNVAPISIAGISVGEALYTTFDVEKQDWDTEGLKMIPFPFDTISALMHGQPIEFDNGDMLLSFYVTTKEMLTAGVITIRYSLTEDGLKIVKAGTLLRGDSYARGFCEPSVAMLHGKYYMTLRTDEVGLLSTSDDGYGFTKPESWKWDDGTVLENYNTMQRWIRHPDGLYLAYTRKGAHNDHVFRHRAPMFMARFDEDRLCLIKDSEVILVPELGARLGNFSVTDVSDNESWLTTAEWMQPIGCEKYGSDNAIWIARIKWEK